MIRSGRCAATASKLISWPLTTSGLRALERVLRPRALAPLVAAEEVADADRHDAEREHRILIGVADGDDALGLALDRGLAVLVRRRSTGKLADSLGRSVRRVVITPAGGEREREQRGGQVSHQCPPSCGHPMAPIRLARRSRNRKYGAAITDVTIPTGIPAGENAQAPDEVGDEHEQRAAARGDDQQALGRARAAEPAREVRRDERDEADRAGGGHRQPGQQHGRGEQREPRALDADARGRGRSRRRARARRRGGRARASAAAAPRARRAAARPARRGR